MNVDFRIVALAVLLSAINAAPAADALSGSRAIPFQLRYSLQNGAVVSLSRDYYRSPHHALEGYHATPLTTLALSRPIAGIGFYYSHQRAVGQRQHSLALRKGGATIALSSGSGRSVLKTNSSLYPDANPYFVHGGSLSRFNLKSLGIDYQCTACAMPLRARAIGVRLRAAGLETRSGFYLGLSGERFGAGFLRVKRGAADVGSGFSASLGSDPWRLSFNRISSAAGARMQRFAIRFSLAQAGAVSLSYESLENPLYRAGDTQRISLRYQLALGDKPGHPVAAEDEDEQRQPAEDAPRESGEIPGDDEAPPPTAWPSTGLLIGGAVAVAGAVLLLSSGDSGSDNALRYDIDDNAGVAALTRYNPPSVAANREYGGWVYRKADNTYAHTEAVIGDIDSVSIPSSLIPSGSTGVAASFHTHGAYVEGYDNQNFSPIDLQSNMDFKVNGYLGTPRGCNSELSSGCAKKHFWRSGVEEGSRRIVILGPIPN